ncbi:hypothetical protein BD410DRAFT_810708 [Rickenella mellea]|uniref:Ubiquitin-like protease family profile domain-containing protein n=1 Tax=Rickenella mellea TaxID=50990 RepID=A0A4Y7PDC9_9AGAM|nr:hypothetical protein BD410DRAFT_810708 [Rickenella mellea]
MTPDRLDEILDEMEDDIVLWRDMHRVLDERFATGELEDIGAEGVIEYNRRGYEIREWHEADQKPIIMWGLAIWWGDLYNTDDLRRIYVLPHNILQRIELAEDPHGQIGHVFDVDVLFFPFHQRERDHWSVAAIMNPGSIFEATNRLDAQSYPVILSADSSPWATFEYSDFEIVRKWFYEHAKEKHPDRQILTAICFARLRVWPVFHVPIEEHNWDCAYHVLTNMRMTQFDSIFDAFLTTLNEVGFARSCDGAEGDDA